MNNGYKTTLVYNYRMIDFCLLVAKSIYALLLTQNVGMNFFVCFSEHRRFRARRMLPINKEVGGSLRGEGAAGTGDKVRTFTGLSLCSMSRNCP